MDWEALERENTERRLWDEMIEKDPAYAEWIKEQLEFDFDKEEN